MNFVAMRYNRLSTLFMIIRLVKWLCIFFKEVFAWSKSPPIDATSRRFVLFLCCYGLVNFFLKISLFYLKNPTKMVFEYFQFERVKQKQPSCLSPTTGRNGFYFVYLLFYRLFKGLFISIQSQMGLTTVLPEMEPTHQCALEQLHNTEWYH